MALSPGMSPNGFPQYVTKMQQHDSGSSSSGGSGRTTHTISVPPPAVHPSPKTSLALAFKNEVSANNPYNNLSALPPSPLPPPPDLPAVSSFVSEALAAPPTNNPNYAQLLQQLRGRKEPKMLWRLLLCLGRGRR